MNKQKFTEILSDHSTMTAGDVAALKKLAESYPYSQLLHSLVAKGSYNNILDTAQVDLHVAAMYATDRKVLKTLITEKTPSVKTAIAESTPPKKTISKLRFGSLESGNPLSNNEAEALRLEVLKDLEQLMESKKHYAAIIGSSEGVVASPVKKKKEVITKETLAKEDKAAKKGKSSKPKNAKNEKSTVAKSPKKLKKSAATKKADKLDQNDIIDNFIKQEPSISKKLTQNADDKSSQPDLSEPSVEFGEDLATENLALILIKQGRKDKAIDIYKKLIWKFPQKKAYFATQIEALKK